MSYAFEYQDTQFEFPNEPAGESQWEFAVGEPGETDTLETELAWELLGITTDEELDEFLGKLASSVFRGASKFIRSPIGRALGGVLKKVGKIALPAVGGALGSLVAPGVGTAIGSKLGSVAGGLLEVGEAEMMGPADAQYETAQRYVQFARGAYRNAARIPPNVPPRAAARSASISAARIYAPSLLRDRPGRPRPGASIPPWRRRRYPGPTTFYTREPSPDVVLVDQDAGAGADLQGDAQGRDGEGRWVRRGGTVTLLGI
jgi:uncharacterized protein (DUF697 family)